MVIITSTRRYRLGDGSRLVVDDVLERLHDHDCRPRKSGAGWSARCPAHDDKNPSLSISEGREGGVVVHCHAGCTTERVCTALGLDLTDLAPPKSEQNGNGHRHEVARYRYEDETSSHVYDVIRWDPKGFSQAPADGRRGAGAMQGVRRVPYHLPQLIAAIKAGTPIYVCEGEKDADAITKAGGVATTNPGGAGKWQASYNPYFAGANVVIIADQDDVGRRHADEVKAHLTPVAQSVAIVQPLAGKDATDHLKAGHSLADLAQPPRVSRFRIETTREFFAKAGEDVPCIIRGLWPEGSLGFISGPPKARKTWLAMHMAVCVSSGRPVLGRFAVPKPVRVLYVALEGNRAGLRARGSALIRGVGIDPPEQLDNLIWAYKPPGIDLADPEWTMDLADTTTEANVGLVIVDVLRAAATIDENQAKDFAKLRNNLGAVHQAGASVAILHHFGKLTEISKERSPAERMSGTGAMRGAADVGLYLTSKVGAEDSRVSCEIRDLAAPDDFAFTITGHGTGEHGGYTHRDTCRLQIIDTLPEETDIKAPASAIKTYILSQRGTATPGAICEHFKISRPTLISRRDSLEAIGVAYTGDGKHALYTVPEYDPYDHA